MGAVFKAEDQRLGRIVAIKRLLHGDRGDHGGEAARRRLVREARTASGLSHPNIVTIFAIEESGDDAFIVMEYLQTRGPRGPLAQGPRVFAIGAEMADALACAHAAGMVHRDVKPQNVMISPRGTAKVLDFGIARPSPGPGRLPGAPRPAGSPARGLHVDPEQLRGQPLDGRCDLFALGCVLYEAVTGRRAFPADNVGTPRRADPDHRSRGAARARPRRSAGPGAVILRALAKEPSRRFAGAVEMPAALRLGQRGDATSEVGQGTRLDGGRLTPRAPGPRRGLRGRCPADLTHAWDYSATASPRSPPHARGAGPRRRPLAGSSR